MGLVMAGFAPHPPLLIPEVGGAQIKAVETTQRNLQELSRRVKDSQAESLVIISPHAPVSPDAVTVLVKEELAGDFGKFGARKVQLAMETDQELFGLFQKETYDRELRINPQAKVTSVFSPGGELDHGVTVPLYYLQEQGVRVPGLVMAFSMEPVSRLYQIGQALQQAIEKSGKRVALIASGDLSHRLTPQAPAGYDPQGKEFDEKLVELVRDYRVKDILNMDAQLLERAGECGYRSLVIALGCLDNYEVEPEVLSYEGPFGVGYMVASFTPKVKKGNLEKETPKSEEEGNPSSNSTSSNHSSFAGSFSATELVGLARESIEHYLKHGRELSPLPPCSKGLMEEQGGVFVTLKKASQLRGCIGTVMPTKRNLAEEITANAVKAAFEDPRFPSLQREELDDIVISVDVLSPMEKVDDPSRLDAKRWGVMVKKGRRSGLLLPDLEGIDTVEEQLRIAKEKGGISPDEDCEIYCFSVTRYAE